MAAFPLARQLNVVIRERAPLNRSARFIVMEAAPGFEPGVKALQASALPLGQAALYAKGRFASALAHTMERTTGLEPATPTLARLCSTN